MPVVVVKERGLHTVNLFKRLNAPLVVSWLDIGHAQIA
jgi:hypothetical protein